MDLSRMVAVHGKIKNARAELKRTYEAEDAKLKQQQSVIETAMLKHLLDTKSKSSRTDCGTFYMEEDVIPVVNDWDAFYAFIKENDAFEALERRAKKTFVETYMKSSDVPPPGVSTLRKNVIRVRTKE